jgi:transposase InsO family protein
MKRLFRKLKTEQLNYLSFINHYSVVDTVARYISFYNYKRLHSDIDYKTPHQKTKEMKKEA